MSKIVDSQKELCKIRSLKGLKESPVLKGLKHGSDNCNDFPSDSKRIPNSKALNIGEKCNVLLTEFGELKQSF